MSYREEFYGDFKIVEYKPYKVMEPGFGIVALPDTGLVGVIGAGHIVKSLDLKEVGGIDSYNYLPPIAVISKKSIRLPIRIFANGNVVSVYSEFMPSTHSLPLLAKAVLDYLERRGVNTLVMSSGLAVQNRFELEKLRTFYITNSSEIEKSLENSGALPFENGYLVGPYAVIIKEAFRYRMNVVLLLTEAFLEFPDPEASARNLKILSKLIGKEIDVKDLIEQAEIIRIKARDAMKSAMSNLSKMRKDYELSAPLNI